MATLVLPTTFVDRTVPTASNFNGNFSAITAVLNGGIDTNNVDQTAIATVTGTQTLTNKTLTSPVLYGNVNGWIAASDTWTYASASTFTVSGDRTGIFTKGTRLLFTQTTAKYAVVVASSYSAPNTTVMIAVNTDYTIANAAITLPYYSYAVSPQGYPTWFSYTPTVAAGASMTYTSLTLDCKYAVNGASCTVKVYVDGTIGGTPSSYINVTLPINTADAQYKIGCGAAYTNTTTPYAATAWNSSAQHTLSFSKYDASAFSAGATQAIYCVCTYKI